MVQEFHTTQNIPKIDIDLCCVKSSTWEVKLTHLHGSPIYPIINKYRSDSMRPFTCKEMFI